jgi:hypothetical protein
MATYCIPFSNTSHASSKSAWSAADKVPEHLRHRLAGRAAVHLALHHFRADADVVPPGVVVPEGFDGRTRIDQYRRPCRTRPPGKLAFVPLYKKYD